MAKNFIQDGDLVTIPAPADIASGALLIAGSLIGVTANSAKSGELVPVHRAGVWALPKAAGAIALGAKVYWVAANSNLSTTSVGNTLVGIARDAAADAATTVNVILTV